MSRFEATNLIRLFDFYLVTMFLLGLARRYPVYWDALRLLIKVHGRWPKLLGKLKEHHGVLVTKNVIRPVFIALALTAIQMICSRILWPQANLAVGDVLAVWWRMVIVIAAAIPMIAVDLYFILYVGSFDRVETEKYFDEAEHWLNSWKTPMIRTLTLGYVNPTHLVDREVKKGLELLGETVSWVSRWVAIQVGCRVTFGLVIWLLCAFSST